MGLFYCHKMQFNEVINVLQVRRIVNFPQFGILSKKNYEVKIIIVHQYTGCIDIFS